MRTTMSLAVLTFGLIAARPALAGEVLQNPGFESGALSPWFQDRTFGTILEDWNVTTTSPHSGTFAATDVGNAELRQNFAPVAVSNITDVSFWAMHPDAGVTLLAYDFFYTDGSDHEFVVNTSGTGYNFFDVTGDLTPGLTLAGFSIFGNSGGRTFVDDASITTGSVVPEPSSLALCGVGLAVAVGVAARRRKSAASKQQGPG